MKKETSTCVFQQQPLLTSGALLAGCNTVRGVASDVSSVGDSIRSERNIHPLRISSD